MTMETDGNVGHLRGGVRTRDRDRGQGMITGRGVGAERNRRCALGCWEDQIMERKVAFVRGGD